MQELIKQIKQWGIDRGIDKCDPLLQTTKTLEECMELQRAIIRYEHAKVEQAHPERLNCTLDINHWNRHMEVELTNIKDAIGDIFITLVMLNMQKETRDNEDYRDIIKYLDANYDKDLLLSPFLISVQLGSELLYLQRNIFNNNIDAGFAFGSILYALQKLTCSYDLTLKECVEYSYNEIKDRKGSIVDGLWEKEVRNG